MNALRSLLDLGLAAAGLLDRGLARLGELHGARLLRWAVGLVYLWYGALKLVGASPAVDLVVRTVTWLPPRWAVWFVGGWEVLLGLALLIARPGSRLLRATLGLLLLHVAGTFQVFFLLPDEAFQQGNPLLPTLEGQYAFKNVVVVAAALALRGGLRPTPSAAEERREPVLPAAGGGEAD
ncbi:MAG TPA: hypothetical protein VFP50_20650 [Anaeromyxobacteraceae bacterium]|nr:hypothetical protein [Anaeromyxobacteraceae bacterium]